MGEYWTAFIIVMGLANIAGFGVVLYLKHERKDGRHRHG